MKYLINHDNIRNFDIYETNKLPHRAYFIPYSCRESLISQTVVSERYNSDKITILNGAWDFKYYETESELNILDTDTVIFDKINVPSTWQRTGYRKPCYINQRYEFYPKLYPNMSDNIPLGVYRKYVEIADNNKQYFITFLGVMSSLDLYINGKFVGYSEGAHNSHEFDITKFIKKGQNEIVAVVSKWSTGTYLECQDMFRENGIFRDVFLTENDPTFIFDYDVKTTKINDLYNLTLRVQINGNLAGYYVGAELIDNGKIIAKTEVSARKFAILELNSLKVKEWNAEIPKTYDLIIYLKHNQNYTEFIKNITGFKGIKIDKNIFYLNNRPIKIKGVNHHDTDMDNGYVLTAEQTEQELKLMKDFNINAIRTSHYPPDPILLNLADKLGLYIIDEADIETHGTYQIKPPFEHLISNNLKWLNRYTDRVSRMYYRDRNHPSIIMWSLGNEAGGYKCQDECYKMLKKLTDIPIHYEGVIRTKRFCYDVISEMYPTHDHVEKIGQNKLSKYQNKPYFMCEYAHAMGVGPGAVEEYWQTIYKHNNLLGGCVWEWADHAVHHQNGKYEFTYGGDHGEEKHDKNFCVDGLLYPDKTPHTGAYVIKNVYRPVRSEMVGYNLKFTNTNCFKNANYLTIKLTELANGKVVNTINLTIDIEPLSSKNYPIQLTHNCEDSYLNIEYYDGEKLVGIEQHIISNNLVITPNLIDNKKVLTIQENDTTTVNFNNGKFVLNKKTGNIINYIVHNQEFISQKPLYKSGFMPNLVRASIDNDSYGLKKPWQNFKLDKAHIKLKKLDVVSTNNAEITIIYNVKNIVNLFKVVLKYTIHYSGLVDVDVTLIKGLLAPLEIQRFGLLTELPMQFNEVEFYGRGSNEKMENLSDLKDHTTLGYYKSKVSDLHENYIMPQDNTNILDTKYLKIKNDKFALNIYGKPTFSFSIHDYTQDNLDKAKHIEDLKKGKTISLSIDGFMRGTGTNTCGEDTLPKYKVLTSKPLHFSFSFVGSEN